MNLLLLKVPKAELMAEASIMIRTPDIAAVFGKYLASEQENTIIRLFNGFDKTYAAFLGTTQLNANQSINNKDVYLEQSKAWL